MYIRIFGLWQEPGASSAITLLILPGKVVYVNFARSIYGHLFYVHSTFSYIIKQQSTWLVNLTSKSWVFLLPESIARDLRVRSVDVNNR